MLCTESWDILTAFLILEPTFFTGLFFTLRVTLLLVAVSFLPFPPQCFTQSPVSLNLGMFLLMNLCKLSELIFSILGGFLLPRMNFFTSSFFKDGFNSRNTWTFLLNLSLSFLSSYMWNDIYTLVTQLVDHPTWDQSRAVLARTQDCNHWATGAHKVTRVTDS